MTVKELITQLLDCDMDKEIYESGLVRLNFDNRNHRVRGGTQHDD